MPVYGCRIGKAIYLSTIYISLRPSIACGEACI